MRASCVAVLVPILACACSRSTGPARAPAGSAASSPTASPACALVVNASCAVGDSGVAPSPGQAYSMHSQPVAASVTLRRGNAIVAQRSFDGTTCFSLPPGEVDLDVVPNAVCGPAHMKVQVPGIATIDCNGCPQPAEPARGPAGPPVVPPASR